MHEKNKGELWAKLEDKWMKILLENNYIDKEGSLKWLCRGVLNYDGERIILAAQDYRLTTKATVHIFDITVES